MVLAGNNVQSSIISFKTHIYTHSHTHIQTHSYIYKDIHIYTEKEKERLACIR